MKKFFSITVFLIVFFLSGCGSIDANSHTNINSKGGGEFSFKLTYDNIVSDVIKGSVLDQKNKFVSRYMKDNKIIEEYKVKFKNINELNKKLSPTKKDICLVSAKKKMGLTKNIYEYEMKVNPNFIKNFGVNNTEIEAMNSNDKENIKEFINTIPFTNIVNVPGKVIETNAIENTAQGLKWSYYIGQINDTTSMKVSYEVENKVNKVLISIAIIIMIGSIVYLINNKKVIN